MTDSILDFKVLLGTDNGPTDESAGEALRISQGRLATALAIGRMGIYDVDVRTEVVWWSSEMFEIFGVDAFVFVPSKESVRPLVHPDDWHELMALRAKSMALHRPLVHEFRVVLSDGQERWISNRAQTAYDDAGQPTRHFGIAVDVTERRRTEQALREQATQLYQADVRKNQFLAMLAHELRGPLAPIRNAARVLEISRSADPALAHVGGIIDRHVKHLTRLVDDLLDVARVSTGKVRLRRTPCDLVEAVRQGLEMAQPMIDAKSHVLVLDLPEHPVTIDGDITRLAQVVSNLVDNAAKYTEPGGSLALSLVYQPDALTGGHARVIVKDNGLGIRGEALDQLFDLFYQADADLDRAPGGLGIGLSLVRDLIEMHGGHIVAQSAGLGLGSEFIVTLPLFAGREAEPFKVPDGLATTALVTASKILIVDDNIDAAESQALVLQLDGHDTQMAFDGPSGIEMALRWRPALILLDLGLPGMDGYSVCRTLRQQGLGAVKIVAVTGYGEPDAKQRSREAGFDDHQVKPVDAALLVKYLA